MAEDKEIDDRLVTIATYTSPMEAQMAKVNLELAGIDAILLNENFSMLRPVFSLISGGIPLQVWASDSVLALEVLRETSGERPTETAQTVTLSEMARCPECGSRAVEQEFYFFRAIFALMTAVFLGAESGLRPRKWRCRICAARWTRRPYESDESNSDEPKGAG